MKKIVFTIATVFAIGITANAQEVKFGPKAGVNFSNLSKGSDFNDAKMLTSFHVGAVAEIKFNDKFSVEPELVYSSQGSEVTNFSTSSLVSTIKNDYINIPIMAKYYIIEGFSVEAGPQVGFLVKSETEVAATSPLGSTTVKNDTKDSYNSTDFGVNFGLAYDFTNGFFINGRYNLGLTDVLNENNGDAVKNNVIQVGVGFKF